MVLQKIQIINVGRCLFSQALPLIFLIEMADNKTKNKNKLPKYVKLLFV